MTTAERPRQETNGKVYARPTGVPQFTYINRQGDRDAIERDGYVTLGDLEHVDQDGYLFITDRRTDLILSGGVNIYPAEIEHVLWRCQALVTPPFLESRTRNSAKPL